MLDDYSLRLLAEIGIDVYVPRAEHGGARQATGEATAADAPQPVDLSARVASAGVVAEIAIVAARGQRENLLKGLMQSFRFAGVESTLVDSGAPDTVLAMSGVVVLGESLARTFGSGFSAAQHAALEWIMSGEPEAIGRSAQAKRALWGEIKRVSRRVAANRPGLRKGS